MGPAGLNKERSLFPECLFVLVLRQMYSTVRMFYVQSRRLF